MTVARARRSLMERLLAPESVAVFGGDTAEGMRLRANLEAGGFSGTILEAPLGTAPDLAVVASGGAQVGADLAALRKAGGRAGIVVSHVADLGALAAASGVRVMGPSSFGLAVPRLGLNASLSHMAVPGGNIALVTQSASLARAVVDWAGPNGVGFSHVVGIGANLGSGGGGAGNGAVAGGGFGSAADLCGGGGGAGLASGGDGAGIGADLGGGGGFRVEADLGAKVGLRMGARGGELVGAGPEGGLGRVTGAEVGAVVGLGFGAVLDVLSRDPGTRLILLDIRRVRDRRAFISAARAAARQRPVVALHPGSLLLDPTGQSDAVFEAALARAGVLLVRQMDTFLAAAEAVSRARPLRKAAVAVVTNAIGPGRLAADAVLRAGLRLAVLPEASHRALTASLPAELTQGLVYTGSAAPTDIASIAAMVGAVPEVGGVLVLLAPTGPGDTAATEALIAAAQTARLPVLTCIMGETTAAAHRRRVAEAGLAVFATPEQAVQAFAHLLRHRAARQAALELPPSRVLEVSPDHAAAERILAGCRGRGGSALSGGEARALLACYGLASSGTGTQGKRCFFEKKNQKTFVSVGFAGVRRVVSAVRDSVRKSFLLLFLEKEGLASLLRITIHDDPTFGPAIGLSVHDGAAYDLPPLNLALARSLAARAGVQEPRLASACADALVRVSQMVVDLPELDRIELAGLVLRADEVLAAGSATVSLRGAGERARLAISPYPDQLAEHWSGGGQGFTIRPIRPEDAAAHAALVGRVPAEDLRYRFFTALREVSPEQMARLTQIDYDREMAFVAVRDGDQATVGVARLVCEAAGQSGEFAILVEPDSKGLGLGLRLMQRLVEWARAQGIPTITGQVLADNQPMLGFVRHLGFELRRLADEPDVVEVVLEVRTAVF